jgi:hypothetical protein
MRINLIVSISSEVSFKTNLNLIVLKLKIIPLFNLLLQQAHND